MFQQDNTLGKSIKDKSKSSTYKVTISLYMKHICGTLYLIVCHANYFFIENFKLKRIRIISSIKETSQSTFLTLQNKSKKYKSVH